MKLYTMNVFKVGYAILLLIVIPSAWSDNEGCAERKFTCVPHSELPGILQCEDDTGLVWMTDTQPEDGEGCFSDSLSKGSAKSEPAAAQSSVKDFIE